ncbi:MAG TPA: DUF2382 domain-containing protein [Noviherbaspirillum sp.]
MANTVVGVYDSYAQAQNAMNELIASGFSREDIELNPEADRSSATSASTAGSSDTGGSSIGNFFRSLFGSDEDRSDRDIYSEAVRRGSCVLTVHADDDTQCDRAADIMNRFDPVDIDERTTYWRSQGWSGYDESSPRMSDSEIENERRMYAQARTENAGTNLRSDATGEETRIPVVEEQLNVGKRAVQRGGVRVFSRVREEPVHESVNLREEHVKVERHPVDQPASEADMAAFKEGSVELRETAEEPVVSKTARVVEEVVVGKEVTQETQNIDDTVRRTDVDVEQLGASAGAPAMSATGGDYADTVATSDDADYRSHWQNAYGQSGGRYEDYDAAYRYGSTMAGSERFRNYRWEDAEPDMRREWETSHPESTWDKVKDAVRYGAERVTGRGRH